MGSAPAGKRRSMALPRLILGVGALLCIGCDRAILHELDELRAAKLQVALRQAGIAAEKERDGSGWSLRVAPSEADRALSFLKEQRALREPPTRSDTSPAGLFGSREERTFQVTRAVAAQLEQTLERLPGVLEARVHINAPPQTPFRAEKTELARSAGALLLLSGEEPAIVKEEVQQLVAAAAGLESETVVVMMTTVSTHAASARAPAALMNVQAAHTLSLTALSWSIALSGAVVCLALLLLRRRRRGLRVDSAQILRPEERLRSVGGVAQGVR